MPIPRKVFDDIATVERPRKPKIALLDVMRPGEAYNRYELTVMTGIPWSAFRLFADVKALIEQGKIEKRYMGDVAYYAITINATEE